MHNNKTSGIHGITDRVAEKLGRLFSDPVPDKADVGVGPTYRKAGPWGGRQGRPTGFAGAKGETIQAAVLDGSAVGRPGMAFNIRVDDGAVEIEQTGGSVLNEAQLRALLEDLEDRGLTRFRDAQAVHGVDFSDPSGVQGGLRMVVEAKTPYQMLREVLDDGAPAKGAPAKKPVKAPAAAAPPATVDPATDAAFGRIMEEKREELARSLARAQEKVETHLREVAAAESLLATAKDEAKLLTERLRQMGARPAPNGYLFRVSERLNEAVSLDEATEKAIRSALSKVRHVNADAFMRLFVDGEYRITVMEPGDGGDPVAKRPKEIKGDALRALSSIGARPDGDGFLYSGDMDWHALVDHFVSAGFEPCPKSKN